ncbi:MAG: hypothetical protein AB1641_19830 [Thermodesulfobacteriota bacterium]
MKVDEAMWSFFQQHLGYSDEEMKAFKARPENEDILAQAPALMRKTIVAEVIESHGCNSSHKVGDKFYFDGGGNLLTKLNPSRVCIFALSVLPPAIFAANELFYAGVDPNTMRFRRVGCTDVGVKCGGWGRIVMEIRMEDRQKA